MRGQRTGTRTIFLCSVVCTVHQCIAEVQYCDTGLKEAKHVRTVYLVNKGKK